VRRLTYYNDLGRRSAPHAPYHAPGGTAVSGEPGQNPHEMKLFASGYSP